MAKKVQKKEPINKEIDSGISREIPKNMKTKDALAWNQNNLAMERTEFAKIRTDLALTNTQLAINRTHLAYLRTIVTLVGTAATIYKALPLLGVARTFTTGLSAFLLVAAIYFAYKDWKIYPSMNRKLQDVQKRAEELAKETEEQMYRVEQEEE